MNAVDIGKFSFTVAYHGKNNVKEYENTSSGMSAFFKEFKRELPKSLVILEATGGYEMELLLSLCDKEIAVHRANTRKVKNFIRSFGHAAKTDALDARLWRFMAMSAIKSWIFLYSLLLIC